MRGLLSWVLRALYNLCQSPPTPHTTETTDMAKETISDTPTSTRTPLTEHDTPIVSDASCRVKLPKIVQKTLILMVISPSGKPFGVPFEFSIHFNPTLSTVDKFTCLNSLLESTAMRAVAGLKLTTTNYNKTIEMLKRDSADHLPTYEHLVRIRICCISNQYKGSLTTA